jgi:hypothetical protein
MHEKDVAHASRVRGLLFKKQVPFSSLPKHRGVIHYVPVEQAEQLLERPGSMICSQATGYLLCFK